MGEIKSTSIRADIMEMLKTKFSGLSFWSRTEADIALRCAELIEPSTKEKRDEFIKQLKSLKIFISQQDVPDADLKFIDEEIELHEQSNMISLYEEKDDSIEDSVISSYSRLGKCSEGIVAIPQAYNYNQLSKLTNGVYHKTGLVKFYISKEQTLRGQINAEIYEHAQEIPIAIVIESKKIDKETGEPRYKRIKLFGEKFTRNEVNVIKEITLPFYVYRFISEGNNEYILITLTQCEIGDYVITGVQTKCDDYKMLTDSVRLPTKLPFFFAQGIQNRVIKFKNHNEFKIKLENLKINKENFFDYPFTTDKKNKTVKLLHPTWYKWLIWAWLTHENKGLINNYPLHLMIIGSTGSGKSTLMNTLHAKSKETRDIFSGAGSTLKSLVPSFKYHPAQIGYLAGSNRFAFCDEFFDCLTNTKTTKEGSQREESVKIMNDLLEHQKRAVGSGVSKINKVKMTARIIAGTNPLRGMKNVNDLTNLYDASFLSRWLIYFQTKNHVEMTSNSNDSDLKQYKFKIPLNDWISILDYLQTFSAEYDLDKVLEIYNNIPNVFSENLNKHYKIRHKHHIECLIDGIIKTRCFLDRDISFKAKEEDYKILKDIWLNVIKSWIDLSQVRDIDVNEKIFYLPENCQYLYWKICEKKNLVTKEEVEEIALKAMTKLEYYESWNILIDMGVLIESNGLVRPHYISELKDGEQSRL